MAWGDSTVSYRVLSPWGVPREVDDGSRRSVTTLSQKTIGSQMRVVDFLPTIPLWLL